MDPEVSLFDESVRPDPADEFVLADHVPGSLDQGNEQGQRATADGHRLVALEEQAL
jgi:hypothetical protein